jgi:hypothetical protein
MTQADKFVSSLSGELDLLSDADLLSRLRAATGQQPEVFSSLSNERREYDFPFADGSIVNVDIVESNSVRQVCVQVPKR